MLLLRLYLKKNNTLKLALQLISHLQIHPWMLVYDIKAFLLINDLQNFMWKTEHHKSFVCLTSNVPGFKDVKFILEPNERNK